MAYNKAPACLMQAGAFLYMRCVIKDLADHPAGGDGCDRLADALYRQGQGKTDVPLTAGAKAEARRADNACLVDQFQAEGHVECVIMMQYCGKEKK